MNQTSYCRIEGNTKGMQNCLLIVNMFATESSLTDHVPHVTLSNCEISPHQLLIYWLRGQKGCTAVIYIKVIPILSDVVLSEKLDVHGN